MFGESVTVGEALAKEVELDVVLLELLAKLAVVHEHRPRM